MNCMREVTTGTLCADCVNLQIADIAPHHLKPGTVLRERYLIGNVIGEGGFGITYIAVSYTHLAANVLHAGSDSDN